MIIGHQKIVSFFNKSIKNGKLNHAYLFTGPEHLGKFTLACDLAKKITGRNNEINDDIIIVSPEKPDNGSSKKKSIKIESVREMERKIFMTSSGKARVVIIDDAETLNKSAQNALLKVLEEPPLGSVIFLITHNKKKLLPTVVSRCQEKRFGNVSNDEIADIIDGGTQDMKDIIFWSLGRPGLAKTFLSNPDELKRRQEILNSFDDLCSKNIAEKFVHAETLSKDSTVDLIEIISHWIVITREIVMGDKKSSQMSQEEAMKILDKLQKTKEEIANTNAGTRLSLENLFIQFHPHTRNQPESSR